MKMKTALMISILFLFTIVMLPGCQSEAAEQVAPEATETAPGSGSGIVTETMNSGGYTYLLLESGGQSVWVASAEMQVKVGDTVEYMGAVPMKDFRSASLNRTFPMILFAGAAQVQGASGASDAPMGMSSAHSGGQTAMPPGHPAMPGAEGTPKPSSERPEPGSVPSVPGALTIAEVFADRTGLAEKSVKVSGKVVKVNPNIMGTNWIHIQDGTEHEGDFDLLVTSSEVPEVGSVVTAEGKIAVDKDLGAGYFYKILLEGASFSTLKQ